MARWHNITWKHWHQFIINNAWVTSTNIRPNPLLPNSLSGIDLIFTDQPKLAVDRGVHSSLHPNCHHQIIYCKFNLTIQYSPPYEHLVWDYNHADQSAIAKALDQVDWNFLFLNKNVHKQVGILSRTLLILINIASKVCELCRLALSFFLFRLLQALF